MMKHSCLINGYDSLNLTKLDILDGISENKIAVKYIVDGKELPGFPGSSCSFALPVAPHSSSTALTRRPQLTWKSSQKWM